MAQKGSTQPMRNVGTKVGSDFSKLHFIVQKQHDKVVDWCQKRDRDVPTKRYMTTLYCDFSALDTVQNTVLVSALVLNEDSNRCGRTISDQSTAPNFILQPADNFLPERDRKPNQAAAREATMAGKIKPASCCTTVPFPATRSTLAIRSRSLPSIIP